MSDDLIEIIVIGRTRTWHRRDANGAGRKLIAELGYNRLYSRDVLLVIIAFTAHWPQNAERFCLQLQRLETRLRRVHSVIQGGSLDS